MTQHVHPSPRLLPPSTHLDSVCHWTQSSWSSPWKLLLMCTPRCPDLSFHSGLFPTSLVGSSWVHNYPGLHRFLAAGRQELPPRSHEAKWRQSSPLCHDPAQRHEQCPRSLTRIFLLYLHDFLPHDLPGYLRQDLLQHLMKPAVIFFTKSFSIFFKDLLTFLRQRASTREEQDRLSAECVFRCGARSPDPEVMAS